MASQVGGHFLSRLRHFLQFRRPTCRSQTSPCLACNTRRLAVVSLRCRETSIARLSSSMWLRCCKRQ